MLVYITRKRQLRKSSTLRQMFEVVEIYWKTASMQAQRSPITSDTLVGYHFLTNLFEQWIIQHRPDLVYEPRSQILSQGVNHRSRVRRRH